MELQQLRVSENKRFLVYEDGRPFFWLGDTAWELLHLFNKEETEKYLKDRAQKKFSVIQTVALAINNGLVIGNAYGCFPLERNINGQYDPTSPDTTGPNDYSYWDNVDYVINTAEKYGLYVALLPTWGDKYNLLWGKGPEIFNARNAYIYGKWLGERYADNKNIIWVLGGDRPLTTINHFLIVRSLAIGLKKGDLGRHLMTFHPPGSSSSSLYVHGENWLNFNMVQSGHYELKQRKNYSLIKADYEKLPIKPTLDGEPCYEDLPINFSPDNGYFDAADVRTAAYYAVFAGGCGHTYGHNSILTAERRDHCIMSWRDALQRTGASQMQHLRYLMESRPYLERVPDQNIIANNYCLANHMQSTRGKDYAFIYSPCGLSFEVNMGKISGDSVKASWFNPRNGNIEYIGMFENSNKLSFNPPTSGRGNDWVLILDSVPK